VTGSINNHDQTYNPLLEFKAGVTAYLASWSALRTAAESGWGGGERVSQQKAEDLRTRIFETFNGRKCPLPNYDAFDLADDLAIYIEEEFSVTLEDDSERQLAEAVFQLYERCLNGDPTFARQMVAQAASAVELNSQFPVKVQTGEHDDDDDDDEMEGAETSTMVGATNHADTMGSPQQGMMPTNLEDYVSRPLFGKVIKKKVGSKGPIRQLGETAEGSGVVEMDEDGFAPVIKGNRRR
jgi:hypothetical protein